MLVSDIFTSGFFSSDHDDHDDHDKDDDDHKHHHHWWRDRDGKWCHD
jgi:hypothetical protein